MEALDLDVRCAEAGLRGVVAGLHSEQQVHTDAEGLFQTQRHLRRDGGLAVSHVGQGGAADAEYLRRAGY